MMEYVMITGASTGIGYALAKEYAAHKKNVILVATREERLMQVAKEIKEEYQVETAWFVQDLSEIGAAKELYEKVKKAGLMVSVLVNNAGFGCVGECATIPYEKEEQMMILNMISLQELSKFFLQDMLKRKTGRILNVASTGAFQPGPFIATYYATKSFVLSFSEALRLENEPYGIVVATLCPGATVSNFPARAGKKPSKTAMPAEKVAKIAYREFEKGKHVIVPGFFNRLARRLPKGVKSRYVSWMQRGLMKK